MNRTLLPKEGIVAFSCGLAGKYIDDENGSAEVLGLSEGALSVLSSGPSSVNTQVYGVMEGVGTKTQLLCWLKISHADVVAKAIVGPLTDQCLSSGGASL